MSLDPEPWQVCFIFICAMLSLVTRYYAGRERRREQGLPFAASWQLWLTIALFALAILFYAHVLDVLQDGLFGD